MNQWCNVLLSLVLVLWGTIGSGQASNTPSPATPVVVRAEIKEIRIFGKIYPARFNTARGEEAHYHLLVWQGGTSAGALIETPADDLAFHDALLSLGGKPGENVTMAAWQERYEQSSTAPKEKVTGTPLEIRIAWAENPAGIPVAHAFRAPSSATEATPAANHQPFAAPFEWRFGGNRDRWFNRIPFAPRPGCLVCLYSCPSGKVSNATLSVHDYVTVPGRFRANQEVLPADGTPVIVIVRVLS